MATALRDRQRRRGPLQRHSRPRHRQQAPTGTRQRRRHRLAALPVRLRRWSRRAPIVTPSMANSQAAGALEQWSVRR